MEGGYYSSMPVIKFRSKVEAVDAKGSWAMVRFPMSVSQKLGARGRISVRGKVNGFEIRTSAMPTGDGTHHIMFNKAMRSGAKADLGDTVMVEIEPDSAPRKVVIPAEVKKAIEASAAAKKTWSVITPRAREEWVEWIASAKQEATRARRVNQMVQRLASGERRVYD